MPPELIDDQWWAVRRNAHTGAIEEQLGPCRDRNHAKQLSFSVDYNVGADQFRAAAEAAAPDPADWWKENQ